MIASNASSESSEPLEPSVRMKQLIEMSHNITVDKNVSINRYFHSGKELIKSASALELKGDIEKAFVLYLRYMTLFLEKLIHHPEYNKADKAEKLLVRSECNRVFDVAESLKKRILEKYNLEHEKSKSDALGGLAKDDQIQKRSLSPQNSMPDEDEIDRKFNFSQQITEDRADKQFDPFNIEELKKSFDSNNP